MLARMKRLSFDAGRAFTPTDDRLEGVTIAPLTPPADVRAAIFRLSPGGRIARHPATMPQILAVLEGAGHVSGPTAYSSRSLQARPCSGVRAKNTRR
jgi:quercetin dioxygenase-like cupin family protein